MGEYEYPTATPIPLWIETIIYKLKPGFAYSDYKKLEKEDATMQRRILTMASMQVEILNFETDPMEKIW